jgi:transposase
LSVYLLNFLLLNKESYSKRILKANGEGLGAVEDHPRPGRPSQFDEKVLKDLDDALSKSPQDFGLSRNCWHGVVVVEYLKRFHCVKVRVRHAKNMIKKLGNSLRRPLYRYVQASDDGIAEFQFDKENLILSKERS